MATMIAGSQLASEELRSGVSNTHHRKEWPIDQIVNVILSSVWCPGIKSDIKGMLGNKCVMMVNSNECRIYTSLDRVGIGSDNGLSPIRRQAII